MSEFEGYPSFEDWLNDVRLKLYEETKNMTTEEHLAWLRAETEPIMKKYGIKRSTLTPVRPMKRERLPAI